jgi:hypothetical protein
MPKARRKAGKSMWSVCLSKAPGIVEEFVSDYLKLHCNYGRTLTISFWGDITLRAWIIGC